MRVPTCHPDRPHQAKGLCPQCYMRQYDATQKRKMRKRRKDPSEYAENYRKPPRRVARTPECHPDRPHVALGLCRACYQTRRPNRPPADCHPDQAAVADGLCNACYKKRAYQQEPERYRAQVRESQARTRERNRQELLAAYGGRCACRNCPETNPAFLCLDHVNGDGKAHRMKVGSHTYADLRRQGFPQEGYRLLCWNCNAATRFGRACPHEGQEGGAADG